MATTHNVLRARDSPCWEKIMQTEGTLSKWNESKGYGFITPQRVV